MLGLLPDVTRASHSVVLLLKMPWEFRFFISSASPDALDVALKTMCQLGPDKPIASTSALGAPETRTDTYFAMDSTRGVMAWKSEPGKPEELALKVRSPAGLVTACG